MRALVFGGTTEGRELAARLVEMGVETTVSVATPLGAEALSGVAGLTVLTGRRDADGIRALLPGFDVCIDATHPYAVEVTANIRAACSEANVPLRRLLRPSSEAEGVIRVDSCAEAAAWLAEHPGRALLATGAKELSAFAALDPSRLFARILPTHEGLSACEALGLPHRNILALQGPFSQKLNEAMLEQYGIRWMVSKDGGRAGGFDEKRAACRSAGVGLVLVGRPAGDGGETMAQILRSIEAHAARGSS